MLATKTRLHMPLRSEAEVPDYVLTASPSGYKAWVLGETCPVKAHPKLWSLAVEYVKTFEIDHVTANNDLRHLIGVRRITKFGHAANSPLFNAAVANLCYAIACNPYGRIRRAR